MAISSIGYDHWEEFSRAIGAVTIDPLQSLVQYLFPFLGTYFSGYYPLSADITTEASMPAEQTGRMRREIQDLTNCAGIQREVAPFIALSHTFSSFGGTYSCAKPALFLPEQHLFRRQGLPAFPEEREENLAANRWVYSDNEVRFFIARELAQMRESAPLCKLAIKVAILFALFTVFATPIGLMGGLSLYIGALGIYVLSERHFQGKADLSAIKILDRRGIENPTQVALRALEKQQEQNLYRRENSPFARLFISGSGNNLLDLMHPFLTTRIEKLHCEENS